MKKIFVLIFLTASMTFADNDTTETGYSKVTCKRYQNYIGIAGGTTMGYGLSYKRWINDKWGYQINLFPYYKEDKYSKSTNSDTYYGTQRDSGYYTNGNLSLGLTCLRNVVDVKYVRFMAYAGGNLNTTYEDFNYRETDQYGSYYDNYYGKYVSRDSISYHEGNKISNTFTLGGGFGSEFYVWRFSFNLLLGLRGSYNFYTQAKEVNLSYEGGVHFRF